MRTLTLAVAVLFAACSGAVPQLDATDVAGREAEFPGLTVAQLDRGRSLYVQSCSGCHALYPPSSQTPAGWHEELSKMAPKAHLTGDDREAVLRYLLVASQRPAAPTR